MANIDNKIKSQLIDVFRSLNKESVTSYGDGWVNLVKFAPAIKEAGNGKGLVSGIYRSLMDDG